MLIYCNIATLVTNTYDYGRDAGANAVARIMVSVALVMFGVAATDRCAADEFDIVVLL